jgi:hypothetical protein
MKIDSRLIVFLLPLAGLAHAAELSTTVSVGARSEYNDNVRLVSKPEKRVLSATVTPAVRMEAATETGSASLTAKANANRYFNDSQLNSNDFFLDGALLQKFPRDRAALDLGFARDSTLASELEQTGVVTTRRQRSRVFARPSWTFLVTERVNVKLGYDYARAKYDDRENTNLSDNRLHRLYSTVGYRLDERLEASAGVGESRFKADQANAKFTTRFLEGGLDWNITERWRTRFMLGVNRTDIKVPAGNSDENGWQTLASLERQFETSAVSASLGRELNPSGVGALTRTDKVAVGWTGQLMPRLGFGVSGAVYRNNFLGQGNSARDDRYYRVDGSLEWSLTEMWKVETGLSYARQNPDEGEGATAKAIYVGARYEWPKFVYGR